MMPLLGAPWWLLSLIAVPVLLGIYLFQRRFRSREVSSLLLWEAIGEASMGGRTREPLRLPLPFWLELTAIVLIVLGAATPLIARWRTSRPLMIVLDDSLSMSAGGTQPARERALGFVRETAERGGHDPIRVVFAGVTPELASGADLEAQLRGWRCNAPSADLDAAISLVTQLGGPNALILVVTDHAPSRALERGAITWRAFGSPRPNAAIVAAARSGGDRDRVLLEVAGFGASRTTLTVSDGPRVLHRRELALAPGARARVQLELPAGSGSATEARAIEARLTGDDARFDDRAWLLPEQRPPVRVALAIANAGLRAHVEGALGATARATITEDHPDLRITDGAPPAEGWSVVVDARKSASAFVGPFVLDRTHPVTTGLDLGGAIWGVAAGSLAGEPVILAGAQPLLTDEKIGEAHRLRLRYDPATSNVHRSPVWPSLWWNVLAWRAGSAPGVQSANVSLGNEQRVTLRGPSEGVVIEAPDGSRRTTVSVANEVVVAATQPGLWNVVDGEDRYPFAVNALTPAESDLAGASSGSWGGWSDGALTNNGYQDIAWLLVLFALVVLVFHQRVTAAAAGS